MDSKLVKAGILIVSLCALTVFLVVLAVNGFFDKQNREGAVPVNNASDTNIIEKSELVSGDVYAWMEDETFFDAEKIADGKYEVEEVKTASYKVSTIDKDLRIVFLDEAGELITGRKFTISIAGLDDYSDIDRDGIIYVEDVSPGTYSLSMASIKGYAVPENPTSVTVNASIEYKAVADISYLIKTEADIDAKAEDTAQRDADEETTGNSAIKTVEGAVFGIDVSKWNNEIDWKKVSEAGVKFAIIRCGYRGSKTGAIVEDPYFEANIKGASEADIPVGIYFFTQAVDEREAVEEASAVMSLIKEYDITYPVFIDTESAGGKGRADELDVVERSKVVQAFCETIRSGGYKAGVYASKNWFNNRLDISKMSSENVTWLAEYADKPTYGATYQLWQYSSAGRINGIEGRVDMNISYLDVSGADNTDNKTDKKSEKDKESKERDEDGQADGRDV